MTVKEYLSQVYYTRQNIDRLCERRDRLRSDMMGLSSPSLGDRVQTSPDDGMSRDMAKLDAVERSLIKQILKEQSLIDKIGKKIDRLTNPRHRAVLALRYLNCLPWPDIAERLDYTERRVYQLHGEALAEFKKHFSEFQ